MTLIIDQFPCLSDNFGVLIHDTETGRTAAIDAPEFDAVKHRLAERGWNLDEILVTHHHADLVRLACRRDHFAFESLLERQNAK